MTLSAAAEPPIERDRPVVRLQNLGAGYGSRGRRGAASPRTWAVRGVSLSVGAREIVGLVGGSGSGKTTLARCVAGLLPIDEGSVTFTDGVVLMPGSSARVPRLRGVQVAYQDPSMSLNPRRSVGSVLAEVLSVHRLCRPSDRDARVRELLEQVGLPPRVARLRPAAMSGGMCQRVAIARALALEPRLLIADEVVSALDASVQAQVLNLILDTRDRTGTAVLFITHDLAVVNQVCDSVVVLHAGRVVEAGPVASVLARPSDPYTRRLMSAATTLDLARITRGPAR